LATTFYPDDKYSGAPLISSLAARGQPPKSILRLPAALFTKGSKLPAKVPQFVGYSAGSGKGSGHLLL
jgi:hypothetical protein